MEKDLMQGDPEQRKQMEAEIKKEAEKLLGKNGHEWCLLMSNALEKAAMDDYEAAMRQFNPSSDEYVGNNL